MDRSIDGHWPIENYTQEEYDLNYQSELDDETQTGTLKELNAKPGDEVETKTGIRYTVMMDGDGNLCDQDDEDILDIYYPFRIVSRAAETPKLWRDMTPEEKGALLLAAHEGKVIECWQHSDTPEYWAEVYPSWEDNCAFRIRPEPKRKTVGLHAGTRRIGSIDLIDGKPDPASIRMDEI